MGEGGQHVVAGRVPVLVRDDNLPGEWRPSAETEREVLLRDYLDVLIRRRWLILAFFALVVVLTMFFTLAATPIFKATTLIEIRQENPKIVGFKELEMVQPQKFREFYQTQYDILRSRTLAGRVLDQLEEVAPPLEGTEEASVGWLSRLRAFLPHRPEVEIDEGIREAQRRTDVFLQNVEVRPRPGSFLAELSFSNRDPYLAARSANMLADEYINLSLDYRVQALQKGRAFIERQLAVTKGSLEHSEEELQRFSSANGIVTMDEKENIDYRKLADLNRSLTRVQGERVAKESLYLQTTTDLAGISIVMNNELLKGIRDRLVHLEAQRAKLASTFTDEYSVMRNLQAEITDLRRRFADEKAEIVRSLRADYEAAKKNEELLLAALDQQKREVVDFNQRAIDYKIMKREVDTNRGIYETLLQRLKEVEVTEGIKATNIQVVDPARVPLLPDRPRVGQNLLLALALGLAGGIGLAFFWEHLDSSLKTPTQVEKYLGLPTLGTVPLVRFKEEDRATAEGSIELIAHNKPASHAAEALRTLRASLFLVTADGPPVRMIITSARPQEGKTCVSSNLAVTLAEMGRRVVLVDADLRRPRMHRMFGAAITPGLSNYLAGSSPVDEVLHQSPVSRLDIIPSGPVPPNPAELLDSSSMRGLLDELNTRYDFVLIDAPPVLGFADVPLLSRFAGGVLLVVRAGSTPRAVAKQAGDYLIRLRAKVLGVVLNQVAADQQGYGYYDYGYYRDYSPNPNDEPILELPKAV